jgi:hypothetical protein
VASILQGAFVKHSARIEQCLAEVVAAINTETLSYDGTYGDRLSESVALVARQLGDEIIGEVNRAMATNRMGKLDKRMKAQIRTLLLPRPITVTVPNNQVSKGTAGFGAVVGGVLGTLFAPGPGSVIGAAIGGALGGASSASTAVAQDRAGAAANATAAVQAAKAKLLARQATVQGLITDPAATPIGLPQPPDESALRSLDALQARLCTLATGLRRFGDQAMNSSAHGQLAAEPA